MCSTHSCSFVIGFSSCNLVYSERRLPLEQVFQAGLTILKTKRQFEFSSLSTKTFVPLLMVFHLILLTRE